MGTSSILERNLAALSRTSPAAAAAIAASPPRTDLVTMPTDDGVPTGAVIADTGSRLLASRRHPLEEARRFAAAADMDRALLVVLGFGMGYHCGALAERIQRTGAIFCFEPDVPLLRAVLEAVDHSAWIAATNFVLLIDPDDAVPVSNAMSGLEGVVALGVQQLKHPASERRLEAAGERFHATLMQVVRAVRTTVVTTLVQMETTLRNLLMNIDRYATAPGIEDLRGVASGRPAIIVSAGPSLGRNIDLLCAEGVRERFVIIAVQTVLKTLLARGVRPHFVTALDHHEISRRFYEGLRPEDVEGVTLVAEAKANPAILESFPGAVRIPREAMLDEVLGPALTRPMGSLPPGATVAHLAYYLARHLGCDPAVFIGQDLGFTDGQYYAPGAAIHHVWSGELNPFNTLEMLEWQRIVRSRRTLVRTTDHLGRPVYTDEQMHTYLVQFERDFLADAARGLRVVDATEGGVAKKNARVMALREALAEFGRAGVPGLPPTPPALGHDRLRAVEARLRELRAGVWNVGECSRSAAETLRRIRASRGDRAKVNRLVLEVQRVSQRVQTFGDAFSLVQHLNQTGALNRVRADRRLQLARGLDAEEIQARQVERDLVNVRWLADASDQMGRMLDDAAKCLGGAPKQTRDRSPRPEVDDGDGAPAAPKPPVNVRALIAVDPARGGLGTPRDLSQPLALGMNPLRMLLSRLARCRQLQGVTLLAEDEAAVREIAGRSPPGLGVEVVRVPRLYGDRRAAIAAARLWSPAAWRGGVANITCYDEALCAHAMIGVMEERGIDAAVVLGADWALADPAVIDALVERHRERPDRFRVTFTQSAPGLAGVLIDRTVMKDVATQEGRAGALGTLGAVFGYVPVQPQPDPIGTPACVAVDPLVRTLGLRCIPDSTPRQRLLASALAEAGPDGATIAGRDLAELLAPRTMPAASELPQQVTVELCTGRRASGRRGEWIRDFAEPLERLPMTADLVERVVRQLSEGCADLAVTFAGAGDPLLHPGWERMVAVALRAGAAGVHIRTDLLCDADTLDRLAGCGASVVSVDVLAEQPRTYHSLMGVNGLAQVQRNVDRLLKARRDAGGLPLPWIVPRITRCDAVYAEVESFYDRWLTLAGAAVIDPLPRRLGGERIEPLPRPTLDVRRRHRLGVLVLSDGTVTVDERDILGDESVGNAAQESMAALWRRLVAARRAREGTRDEAPRGRRSPLRQGAA